jgi:hypothetical protein
MKISKRQLKHIIREVLFETKFTAHGPLDREGMQIALGIHDDQLNPKPDESCREEMIDYASFHEDGTVDDTLPANRFVDFFEDYWNDVAQHHGLQTWSLDEMKLAFDSLVEDGTFVITDGMIALA